MESRLTLILNTRLDRPTLHPPTLPAAAAEITTVAATTLRLPCPLVPVMATVAADTALLVLLLPALRALPAVATATLLPRARLLTTSNCSHGASQSTSQI